MHYQKRRLFIGIPLSAPLKKRLSALASKFEGEAFLPVRPENYHVTLLFLGFVSEEDLYEISQKIGEAVEGNEPFEIRFSGITAVDDPEDPKQFWLLGEASEELRELREKLEKSFQSFIREKKSFRPHVTVFRVKRSKWRALESVPQVEQSLNLVEPVETVALFESTVIDGKRSYEIIDSFPLG
jgi:2'-5' RNA ligase